MTENDWGAHFLQRALSEERRFELKNTNEKEEAIRVNIWRDAQLPE